MIIVVSWLSAWPAGAQMLFAFGTPAMTVWWVERRLAKRTSSPSPTERFGTLSSKSSLSNKASAAATSQSSSAATLAETSPRYALPKQDIVRDAPDAGTKTSSPAATPNPKQTFTKAKSSSGPVDTRAETPPRYAPPKRKRPVLPL
jgi:hypothetical protein